MLLNYINTMISNEPRPIAYLRRKSDGIGTFLSIFLMAILLIGGLLTINSFRHLQLESAEKVQDWAVEQKIGYVIDRMASGEWASFIFYLGVYLFFSLIISIICGVWATKTAETTPPSFVIFTKKSEEKKQEVLRRNKRKIVLFFISILIGISTSVAGSFIFLAITK
jgi:hypothetical protein